MFKKLQILILLLFVLSLQVAAQYTNVEFSYRSFRPFVHFQLNFDSYSYHDTYESAYLKGYMDGVNDSYYYHHRFVDLVRDRQIYEAGYRDGLRDQRLMIRLRGHAWYHKYRFRYDDYYSPSYSVRIWLDGLSLAFLHAPAHRLPKRWKHRAHPHFIEYRKWVTHKHHYKKKNKSYHRFDNVERSFKKRIRNNRKKAVQEKKRYGKNAVHIRSHQTNVRSQINRTDRSGNRSTFNRSNERKVKTIKTRSNDHRRTVDKSSKRQRSRSTVKQKRDGRTEKSKRSRNHGRRGNGGN